MSPFSCREQQPALQDGTDHAVCVWRRVDGGRCADAVCLRQGAARVGPALVNRYPVYAADIAPQGFDLVEIDAGDDPTNIATITSETVEAVVEALMDPVRRRCMVEWNYHLARQHYAFEAVTPLLASLLASA